VRNLSFTLASIFDQVPGLKQETPGKPPSVLDPSYFETLERYSHIIYPALGTLALVLLALGVIEAWRRQDLRGLEKSEFKREIILELRRQLGGVTGDILARAIGLDPFKTSRLLEEMQRDGLLLSHTSTDRKTVWRLKGVGPYSDR
jgi:hypothetical protein